MQKHEYHTLQEIYEIFETGKPETDLFCYGIDHYEVFTEEGKRERERYIG